MLRFFFVKQEEFDFSAGLFLSEQTGWDDLGVVEDDAVGGREVFGEVADGAVFEHAAGAVEDEHTGLVPLLGGVLGNESFG